MITAGEMLAMLFMGVLVIFLITSLTTAVYDPTYDGRVLIVREIRSVQTVGGQTEYVYRMNRNDTDFHELFIQRPKLDLAIGDTVDLVAVHR